jgi:hypothetical protein
VAPRATLAPGLSSPSQVPEVARGAAARNSKPAQPAKPKTAARPLYFIRCSGDNGSRRLLEYTYRVGGERRCGSSASNTWFSAGTWPQTLQETLEGT